MEYVVTIWGNLPGLTQAFIVGTAALGILLVFPYYSGPALTYGPAMLMSIGIFGTFLGIAIGLDAFDPREVQASIPGLLDGLKTSMWSSISGLLFALVLKGRQLYEGIHLRNSGQVATGATIDDLAQMLAQVRFALAGDDESTVVGQIKLGRQDANDRLDKMNRDLNEFMQELAKASTEALIKALEEVIRDFNSKINEQFGENFKQLNQAVARILIWQEKYRQQMTEMIEQQSKASKNMQISAEGFAAAVDRSTEFEKSAAALADLLEKLNEERRQIHTVAENLGSALAECKTAIPDMERKVVGLSEALKDSIEKSNETAIRALNTANAEMNSHVREISTNAARQVEELDRALSEQLTQSLDMLGRQLAALSEKFVSDYTPLTERLRQVLTIARGATT